MNAMTRTYRGREEKVVFYAISLSLVLHIAFFIMFVILPELTAPRYVPPKSIDIVIIPGGGGSPGSAPTVTDNAPTTVSAVGDTPAPAEKHPVNAKPEKPVEAVYIPLPPQEIIEPSQYTAVKPEETNKPKPEEQPSVEVVNTVPDNVKTIAPSSSKPSDATKKVDQALAQMNQATQRSASAVQETQGSRESADQAIAQLREKLAAQNTGSGGTGTGTGDGSGSGTGTGPGTAAGVAGPLARYLAAIQVLIGTNWTFSDNLYNGPANATVILEATILATGEITNVKFVQKSGNTYLDESAYKALIKSNSTNKLPPFKLYELNLPQHNQKFRFTPKGLAR